MNQCHKELEPGRGAWEGALGGVEKYLVESSGEMEGCSKGPGEGIVHRGRLEGVGEGVTGAGSPRWAPCGALGLRVWENAAAKSQSYSRGCLILPFRDLQAF